MEDCEKSGYYIITLWALSFLIFSLWFPYACQICGELRVEPTQKEIYLNDNQVLIIGVSHSLRYFQEYRPIFEKLINKSDYIVLEGTCDKASNDSFFGNIVAICEQNNKPIYTADVEYKGVIKLIRGLLETFELLMGFIGWFILAVPAIYIYEWNKKKTAIFLLIGTYFILNFLCMVGIVPVHLIQYNEVGDYRNIKIAKGIEELSIKNSGRILAIHGYAHSEGIFYYLKNPEQRKIKEVFYAPYNIVNNGGLKLCRGINENRNWQEC